MAIKFIPVAIGIATILSAAGALADEPCKPLAGVTMVEMVPSRSGRPEIPVTIAGQSRALILDTGAYITSLTPDAVTDLNLTRSHTNMGLRDILGNVSEELALMPSFQVGRLKTEDLKVFILPDENKSQDDAKSHEHRGLDQDIAGVFGSDLLRNYDVDLDFSSKKLRLFSPDHCPGKVVFWHPNTVAVIPMRIDKNGSITFTMKLDGQDVETLLDTGSNTTVLNGQIAKRLFGIDVGTDSAPSTINGQKVPEIADHKFQSLEVEGLAISNPRVVIVRDVALDKMGVEEQWYLRIHGEDKSYKLILGMPELSKLHIYIDYREKKLYISPAADEVLPAALTGP